MTELFAFLMESAPRGEDIASVAAAFDVIEPLDAFFDASIDRAAAGGFTADRLGYAFLAGYRAALHALDSTLGSTLGRASLCATEEGGAHPRAIRTTLTARDGAFFLDGHKTFATLASQADTLLVVASSSTEAGRNHLQIARIPRTREGIVMRDRDPLAFAPEIPHARITFTNVRVEPREILPGDGYTRVLKPFRTIEDAHVAAAWLGHVVRLHRLHGGESDHAERALACIAALAHLSTLDPNAPTTHVALASTLENATTLTRSIPLDRAPEVVRTRWQRDLPLLEVARTVREMRLEAARSKLKGKFLPPAP